MESRFAVESLVISAVGAELQLLYRRIQFCGGGRSQFCSELAPLVERPSDFLNPSIPDRKYMFRIGTCMKTNFVIDRRFRSAEVSELQLFYEKGHLMCAFPTGWGKSLPALLLGLFLPQGFIIKQD